MRLRTREKHKTVKACQTETWSAFVATTNHSEEHCGLADQTFSSGWHALGPEPIGSRDLRTFAEWIDDEIEPFQRKFNLVDAFDGTMAKAFARRRAFHTCQHVRASQTYPQSPVTLVRNVNSHLSPIPFHGPEECYADTMDTRIVAYRVSQEFEGVCLGAKFESPWLANEFSDIVDLKIRQLDALALRTMIPKLDDGFSLPVFLFELGDLKGMLADAFGLLKRLPRAVLDLFTRPFRTWSKHWLSAVFGWIPFISDVRTIIAKCAALAQTIEQFLAQANTRMTFHFGKSLSPFTFCEPSWHDAIVPMNFVHSANATSDTYEGHDVDLLLHRKRHVIRPQYHATMEFSYHLPELSMATSRLLAGLDVFGVNVSISDVWEVIPFSFVVDWFYSVQSWLQGFDFTNLSVEVRIYDFCRSIRYDLEENFVDDSALEKIEIFTLNNPNYRVDETPLWTLSTPLSRFPFYKGTAYHRWKGVPLLSDETGPRLRTPKGYKLVSLCALATQFGIGRPR